MSTPTRSGPAQGHGGRRRRHDPDRRSRIIDACLEVIAEHGVSGTTHRRVAAAADVPLGSMTYHFSGMAQLLHCAFERHAASIAERFETRLAKASDRGSAMDAVLAIITHDAFASHRDVVLTLELYTLAAREPTFRQVTQEWMARSRAALRQHFDADTSQLLDAMIEGATIHRSLGDQTPATPLIARAVTQLAEPHQPEAGDRS